MSAGLKNKRKQATTERNRGAKTGASNSKRSSIPTATKKIEMALFCGRDGRWVGGGGTGLLAALWSSVRALLGPAGFVVISGGGCGDVGDRDSKLT